MASISKISARFTARIVLAGALTSVPLPTIPADTPFPRGVSWMADTTLVSNPPPTVTIAALGDISFGRNVRARIEKRGINPLSELSAFLEPADISLANLESPIVSPDKEGLYMLRAPPQTPKLLAEAGLDAVSVANNHAFDGGEDAYRKSIAALRQAGVTPVGDPTYGAEEVAVFTQNGVRIAIVAMTAISNGGQKHLSFATPESIAKRVAAAKTIADQVIAYVHAGSEYQPEENDFQRALARAAIDAGAAVYLGAHPHVVEPFEQYKNGVIFYSLGNAVFDQGWNPPAMRSVAVRIALTKKSITAVEAVGLNIPDKIFVTAVDQNEDERSALRNLRAGERADVGLGRGKTASGRLLLKNQPEPLVAELKDGVLQVKSGKTSLLETSADWIVQSVLLGQISDTNNQDLGVLIWEPTAEGLRQRFYLYSWDGWSLLPILRKHTFKVPICEITVSEGGLFNFLTGEMTAAGADCGRPKAQNYRGNGDGFRGE